ncbi:Metallo-dependent phosphatase [Xylaria castorea]|nr:Metallo-dependent phosphatase [Xylaria castorea]
MASNGHRRPQNRILILAAVAFILSAVFLTYMRLDPISLTMSPRPASHDTDDDAMAAAAEKPKHDKSGTEKKKKTYPQVSTLPASHLPTNTPTPRRLMIIGDVHGHLKSLEALLRKAEFSASRGDAVVFAGDMVNKGPDSVGVVALAMRIGAFGVRGNHEERVLRAWEYLEAKKQAKGRGGADSDSNSDDDDDEEEEDERGTITDAKDTGGEEESEEIRNSGLEEGSEGEEEEEEEEDGSQSTSHDKKHEKKKGKKKKGKKEKKKEKKKKPKGHKHKPHHIDLVTAKSLKPEHRAWLSRLPLILRIGDLGPRYGEVLVVHAGLVPGIPLESQDPEAVMTMRTILLPPSYDAAASHSAPDFVDPNSDPSPPPPPPHTENDSQVPLTTTATTTTTTTTTTTDQTRDQPPDDRINEATSKGRKHHHHHHPSVMIPSASRKGIPWAEIWTSYQQAYFSPPLPSFSPSSSRRRLPPPPIAPATVVYGHDAKAGLQMREYAFGVDSGCGNGDTLTGVVFEFGERQGALDNNNNNSREATGEGGGEENDNDREEEEEGDDRQSQGHKTRIRHRLVSVSCAEEH